MGEVFSIACLGDVVGKKGRELVARVVGDLRSEKKCDFVIVNAENSAGGVGVTGSAIDEMKKAGVDCFTLGDHTFQQREFRNYLQRQPDHCIRPANYPPGAPGRGWTILDSPIGKLGVVNIMGRVFMNGSLDCPFQAIDAILRQHLTDCSLVVVDFHAEATSEKVAMGRHLDGRCGLVVGTHTHVQTADAQVLPGGTGYISDLGMCGVMDGVIGMDSEVALARFTTGLPKAYKLAKGTAIAHGVLARFDAKTLALQSIESIQQA